MIGKVLVFLWMFPNLWATIIQAVSSECHLCESLITQSDQCTFLLDESTEHPAWSCPLVFPCGRIISINYDFLMNLRAIKIQKISKCNKFVINTSNVTRYAEFFNGEEKFAPYSVIILLMIEENEEPYVFHKDQTDYMYYNALHVVQFYQSPDQITVTNIQTGAGSHGTMHKIPQINSVLGIMGNNKMHPLIDNEYSNEINISLTHFPPVIIDKYRDDLTAPKDNPTLDSQRFDGVEYRLMTHITKKWKRRFYIPGPEVLDPWAATISDVSARRSNIAMCGFWLLRNISEYYDISQPYMQQCITFIVPRLPPIPRDQYIYLALQSNIWIFYTILVACISFLIYLFVTDSTNYSFKLKFYLFTNSVMQVLAISTQHGITKFPQRISAKVLLMAWFFFSFLLAAIYSTGHTSIVIASLFTKPINTARDMIDKNLIWGDIGDVFKEILLKSENTELIELADKKIEKTSEEAKKLLHTSNYGQLVTILNRNIIAGATENFENVSSNYRIMNTCVFKVYTIFMFQRNTPYAELFNREIPKYVESGLVQYWMNQMNVYYGKRYNFNFFVDSRKMMEEPKVFSVEDCVVGLYVLGIGLTVATIVFILELWYFYGKITIKSSVSSRR